MNQDQAPIEVQLFADHHTAPYILTKPLHSSQKVVERNDSGIIVSLIVQHNYELEREVLGFGDRMKVIAPQILKRCIKERLNDALDLYNYDIYNPNLDDQLKRLHYKGSTVLQKVYTRKEMNHLKSMIAKYHNPEYTSEGKPVYAIRNFLTQIPGLKNVLFNQNLKTILSALGKDLFLTKAIYFDKPPMSNWYVTWHQDSTINVKEKIETDGY